MLVLYLTYLDDDKDKELFEKIFNSYKNQMVTLALSMLNNKYDAEDVVSDVFLRIAQKYFDVVRRIENETDLRNYLLKATKNTVINKIKLKKKERVSLDTVIEYNTDHNHNGIRTSKTVNGTTITYTVDENNNVIEQSDGTNTMKFVYDSNNSPIYMEYDGVTYYYEKNLQGDIVAILDADGNTVVEYSYDIWGKLLGITGELADALGIANPLRYRGYYYDTETELYYLQSRYYSPDLMRFISQDDPVLSNAQGEPLGSNLYAYCLNNPVNYIDIQGTDAYWITDSKTLGGLGHASLLIKIKDSWYYFYFGAKNFTKPVNGPANVIFEKISVKFKNGIIDFNNLNKQLKGKTNKTFTGSKAYKGNGYDSFVYIEGDFNAAYKYVTKVVKKMKYNVIKENCAWLCIEVLQQGKISQIQNILLENLQYAKTNVRIRVLWRYVTISRKSANIIVPSKVHSQIYFIFNSKFYYC